MSSECPHNSILSTQDSDPHPYFEALRSQGEVVWDEGMKGWVALSYESCKFVLVNEPLFRHPYADADATMIEVKGGRRNIVVLQGVEHERMRRFVIQLFTPKNIEMYVEHHVLPITDFLIDRFAQRGKAELVAEFADQLPCRVFMSLFGMDARDDEFLAHVLSLHDDIMLWAGGRHFLGEEATQKALAASHELNKILLPYIRNRREQPGDDLMTRLWAEAPGILDDVTEEDMLATCRELYLGGSDTTVHALSNALYVLLTDADVAAQVKADRERALPVFIEEVMRVWGSVQYRYRVANQDIELGGVQIRKDQVVFTLNAAANRDPQRYGCPAQIDLQREKPRDHLAFNVGPRTCAGLSLARAELRVALNRVLDRLPELQLDPEAAPPLFSGMFTRSFKPLHVLFAPAG
ncbi:cytochrome P450 [Pseudomonas corrugata]|uniref:cytochrome P450 n=1 Tax=Pseudomonas corrugata TaxID=47879 RepID=UPI001586C3E3|nr:cytochrome P450 [Pseudomonas corrugata]MCI0996499.1 cytochrome P450 [Pseudomonas corrugata]NUT64712.1 cytochrome P450 [Pseudomonas corrugata]